MATEYGVGVSRNRFELIDMSEDVDPFEILKIREKEREAKKKKHEEHSDKENKTKEGPVKKEKSSLKESQKTKEEVKSRSSVGGGGIGGERHDDRRNERTMRRQETERNDELHQNDGGVGESKFEKSTNRGDRRSGGNYQDGGEGRPGRGRVFGRGRGLGRERNYDRRGGGTGGYQERSFGGGHQERERSYGGGGGYQDRFSGSGKYEKKDEFIESHNNSNFDDDWGNSDTVIPTNVTLDESSHDNKLDINEEPQETSGGDDTQTTGQQDTPDEELRELTLDEWKALKKREEPTYNIRKAGEGEDLTKWKNMVALKKVTDKGNEEDSEGEYELCEYPQRVGRQKYVKDINFKFAERRRGGGAPRRGRGRDRRGYQGYDNFEGQKIQSKKTAPPPKVDDEHDFPSLG